MELRMCQSQKIKSLKMLKEIRCKDHSSLHMLEEQI
jgi:hypothetical protein